MLVKILVEVATQNLNSFPAEGGISERLNPLSIAIEAPIIDTRKFPVDFGLFTDTFEYNGWSYDSNRPMHRPALALVLSPRRKP